MINNILIDIGHPGHVHLFKNLYFELKKRGINCIVTIKDVDIIKSLLNFYDIPYINLGSKKDHILAKYFKQIKYNYDIYNIVKKNKIELGIGVSFSVAQVSKISPMKSIVFDDDDILVEPFFSKYGLPFCDIIITPDCLTHENRGTGHIKHPSYHELAYLHPKRFIPDPTILSEVELKEGEPFIIMRFNVFKAHHDKGIIGLSLNQKLELVNILKPIGRIFITTEREIEPELKKYQLLINPGKAHSLLAFSTLFIGDSQTMTSEAAVLGVPSLRCNSFTGRISYLEEEEKRYGLTFAFLPTQFDALKEKLHILLNMNNLKEEWQKRRERMLNDKIDVTAFMVWFIENWPQSKNIVEDSTQFWSQFK
jgi:predicted glycosyltransferase